MPVYKFMFIDEITIQKYIKILNRIFIQKQTHFFGSK